MTFKDAFKKLIDNYGFDILHERFRSRSILSDYVGFDLYEKKLIDLFLLINGDYNLRFILMDKGLLKAREFFKSVYPKYSQKYTTKEFVDAINPISEVVCPYEYNLYLRENQKTVNTGKVEIVRAKKVEPKVTPKPLVKPKSVIAPKPKAKRKTPAKIDSIQIKGSPKEIVITASDNGKLEVYEGKMKTPLNVYNYQIVNSTQIMDFNKSNKKYIVKIPKRGLDKLHISVMNSKVTFDKHSTVLPIKELGIVSNNGSVLVVSKTDKCFIKTLNGDVKIIGKHKAINVSTYNGNVNMELASSFPLTKVKGKTQNGYFKCTFTDGTILPQFNKLKNKYRKIKKHFYIGRNRIEFDVETDNGIVRIK